MCCSWITLLPPTIVLACALFTRRVILSLLLGIISAALIITSGDPFAAFMLSINQIVQQALDVEHLFTFGFLFSLGILIQLLTFTGGLKSYTTLLQKIIPSAKAAELTSLSLSLSFFMDDYLNSLTVGAIMRPLTDKFKIPRAKLAFLVDSMSAPLCVLIPATSWVATILVQLEAAGISTDLTSKPLITASPFAAYLGSLPFVAYPIFIIITAWVVAAKKLSFGLMKKHEKIAEETGNLFGGAQHLQHLNQPSSQQSSIADFALPVSVFASTTIWALLTLPIFPALFLAGSSTLTFSSLYFLARKKITIKSFIFIAQEGILLMKNSIALLLLAWTLSSFLKNDLKTGAYLAQILLHTMPIALLPLMIFITATIVSAATGSAWGTIAVLTPLAIPTAAQFAALEGASLTSIPAIMYPIIGAVLSGAVAGGHMSPITDSTLMASTSTGARHFDHVTTQIHYSIPALIGACSAFIISGIALPYTSLLTAAIASLLVGISITIIILALLNHYSQ